MYIYAINFCIFMQSTLPKYSLCRRIKLSQHYHEDKMYIYSINFAQIFSLEEDEDRYQAKLPGIFINHNIIFTMRTKYIFMQSTLPKYSLWMRIKTGE